MTLKNVIDLTKEEAGGGGGGGVDEQYDTPPLPHLQRK